MYRAPIELVDGLVTDLWEAIDKWAAIPETDDTLEARIEAAADVEKVVEQDISRICYKGNSVGWWWSKAVTYRSALGSAWEALREAGIQSDGETDVAAGIRKLAARVPK